MINNCKETFEIVESIIFIGKDATLINIQLQKQNIQKCNYNGAGEDNGGANDDLKIVVYLILVMINIQKQKRKQQQQKICIDKNH